MEQNPYSAETDEALLHRITGEDDGAVAALILRYLPVVRRIASRFTAVGAEHEDFVQEGLIGFLSAVRTYRADSACAFNTYARVCVVNRMKKAVHFMQTGKYALLSDAADLETVREKPADGSADPEQMVLERESFRHFSGQIGALLSGKERAVFLLYLEGYEPSQIAKRCRMEQKQVYNALGRARRKLRGSLQLG